MEQKDFILREIEKIGMLIKYLLGKFVPAKSVEEVQHTEEFINNELKEHYGNDLEYILSVEETYFESVFTKNSGFDFDNIELLADLLFTLGNNKHSKTQNYMHKALELYEYIDKKSKTFSLERNSKINSLKSFI